jgi:hypothetical protein
MSDREYADRRVSDRTGCAARIECAWRSHPYRWVLPASTGRVTAVM